MPKMIPAHVGEFTTSNAEKELFGRFREMPDTDNWTVMHSVGIAKHPTQSQGEADYVVVIPGKGTFTLEVKGGLISFDGDRWYSESRNGEEHVIKDPVEEANHANQAFKDFVSRSRRGDVDDRPGSTLFGFGVLFPDCSVHHEISFVGLADEQIGDIDDCSTPEKLKACLLRLAAYWKDAFRNSPFITAPTAHESRLIVDILRPEFSARISLASLIRTVEDGVIRLTDEQLRVLEGLTENERCIVRGNAGTGKTVLALHLADRKAEEDLSVGLFCFNRQLAYELGRMSADDPDLTCGSLTEYMEARVREAGLMPEDIDGKNLPEFYTEDLPLYFMDAFQKLSLPQLDFLILDEGQDLMRPAYLDVLDMMLKGGLKDGSWFFFMDAERQDLYKAAGSDAEVRAQLEARGVRYTNFRLTENCRNSGAITELIDRIFGTETKQRGNVPRGEDVHVFQYKNEEMQLEKLREVLNTLEKEQIPPEKIVILSPLRFENSVVSKLHGYPVTGDYKDRAGKILFSTVYTYKGLDSPVVIITDVNHFYYENHKTALYVGMSRAISLLYMLVREKTWQDIKAYSETVHEKIGGKDDR